MNAIVNATIKKRSASKNKVKIDTLELIDRLKKAIGDVNTVVKLVREMDGYEHYFNAVDVNASVVYVKIENIEVKINDRARVSIRDGFCCVKCGNKASHFSIMYDRTNPQAFPYVHFFHISDDSQEVVIHTKDHIIPKSKGGPDDMDNYQNMCYCCNQDKSNTYSEEDQTSAIIVDFDALKKEEAIANKQDEVTDEEIKVSYFTKVEGEDSSSYFKKVVKRFTKDQSIKIYRGKSYGFDGLVICSSEKYGAMKSGSKKCSNALAKARNLSRKNAAMKETYDTAVGFAEIYNQREDHIMKSIPWYLRLLGASKWISDNILDGERELTKAIKNTKIEKLEAETPEDENE